MNWNAFSYVVMTVSSIFAVLAMFIGAALLCAWLEKRVSYMIALGVMLTLVTLGVATMAGLLVKP